MHSKTVRSQTDKRVNLIKTTPTCRSSVVIETPQCLAEGGKFMGQPKLSFKICYIISNVKSTLSVDRFFHDPIKNRAEIILNNSNFLSHGVSENGVGIVLVYYNRVPTLHEPLETSIFQPLQSATKKNDCLKSAIKLWHKCTLHCR